MFRVLTLPNALLALTVAITLLAMPVALLASAPPVSGGIALVIAPPWGDAGGAGAVARAVGGQEIGPMEAPFAVLAVLDRPEAALRHGAWAVLDGRLLAAVCGVSFPLPAVGSDYG